MFAKNAQRGDTQRQERQIVQSRLNLYNFPLPLSALGTKGAGAIPAMAVSAKWKVERVKWKVGATHASPIGYAHQDLDRDRDLDRNETWMNRMERI